MTHPTKKLGEVCEVVGGGTPSTFISEYWDGDIVWITPKDMGKLDSYEILGSNKKITEAGLKNSSAKMLPKGAVVLSSRAPIGYVAIAGVPLATNQGCRSFICDETKIYNRYLLHFLLTKTELLNHLGGGSTFKEISGSKLKELEIPLPPIGEQRKIVARLEGLLGKIKEAKRLRAEAQEAAQNLLPAELHRIFTQQHITPQKQHTNKLENVGMSSKWEEKELGEVFVFNYGKGLSRSERSASGKYIVYGANGELGRSNRHLIEGEGIIVGRKGSAGEVTRVTGKYWPTDVTYFVTEDKKYDIGFAYYLFKFLNFPQYAVGVKPGINRKEIYGIKIPLPPVAEQKKIVARLDSLSEKIRRLQEHQKSTASDFTSLERSALHKAFSGNI